MLSTVLGAQTTDIKIVFDVTSPDVQIHQAAVRHAKGMAMQYPNAQIEVVVYSAAIDMLLKDKSAVAEAVEELAKTENVTMAVCRGTMKRYNVVEEQLIEGVTPVEDALTEIVMRQNAGWTYIKEAN